MFGSDGTRGWGGGETESNASLENPEEAVDGGKKQKGGKIKFWKKPKEGLGAQSPPPIVRLERKKQRRKGEVWAMRKVTKMPGGVW